MSDKIGLELKHVKEIYEERLMDYINNQLDIMKEETGLDAQYIKIKYTASLAPKEQEEFINKLQVDSLKITFDFNKP